MEELNKKIDFNLTLKNQNNLVIIGANKIISLKPELIQLNTILGGLIISGNNLELKQLNNTDLKAEITGIISSIKFLKSVEKQPFFRKIFK